MRHVYRGAAIGLGLLAFSATAALAQQAANTNDGSIIIQNEEDNNGQQGGDLQLQNSQTGSAGDGSNIVLSAEDASVNATSAQAPNAIAVGGDYDNSSTGTNTTTTTTTTLGTNTITTYNGDVAGGGIYDVANDLALSTEGYAVEDGAIVVGGGIAFGELPELNSSVALVGGNGVAVLSESDEIVDDGSALVIGGTGPEGFEQGGPNGTVANGGNITVTGDDKAAAVGGTGSALFVDDADDWTVFGSENKVSMAELDQDVEMDDGGPALSVGAWTPETPGDLDPNDNSSNPTITTGDIGAVDPNGGVSISSMSGINAFHVNTGVMNQGGIHTVAASVGTLSRD